MEMAPVVLGDTIAVMGAGPIGLLTTAVARLAGAGRIFVADRIPHRLALARAMGADAVIDMRGESPSAAVADLTRGRGADIVFDAAGAPGTINAALRIARTGGRVVLIGLPAECVLPVDLMAAMAKELNIQAIKRSNHNAAAAIELLESGRIPRALVTHRLPLAETPPAFEMLAAYADGVGKVIIEVP